MNLRSHFDNFIAALIEWVFRRKSRGLTIMRAGSVLLLTMLAGVSLKLTIPTRFGSFALSWGDTSIGMLITYILIMLAVGMIIIGLMLALKEANMEGRKRIFVIELRGLRDWDGPPLADHIPASLVGKREPILLDMRQRIQDGVIIDPNAALKRIMSLRSGLALLENGVDRRDFGYAVGGLAPVPLTFLVGVILDDEIPITFIDWDRHARKWHWLGEADDSKRFIIDGMNAIPTRVDEVILAISASYQVDLANARARLSSFPVVHLKLDGASTSSHLSSAKQIALGRQFLDTCLQLHSREVKRIHLFLAAPSTLALRFGTLYDKRNLPPIVVYQYEQGKPQPFAWAVDMPVAGASEPRLISF
jgi:SMODS-associated and fused to various effectors sensor domain/SAVED-fused 2TM effector domain